MKKLGDVLPREVRGYVGAKVLELLDVEVVEEVDGCLPGQGWPGHERNVMWWYKLVNGQIVGFNENPSRGWTFPVRGRAKKDSK